MYCVWKCVLENVTGVLTTVIIDIYDEWSFLIGAK